ncbi:MAG: hypothetical protein LBI53_01280 [Candidatus Peribacteria bacterium]|nr:hypothetical protein [Candidatus Peribacteria bacterium]
MNALGIPHIGKKVAQDITRFLAKEQANSLQEIQTLLTNEEKMLEIYGIGQKTLISLQNFFSNPQTQKLLEQLQHHGLNFSTNTPLIKGGDPDLVGTGDTKEGRMTTQSFTITGSFPFSREQIREKLESQGYSFHESPLRTTDFILIGEKPGNKKQKAEEYGVKIYK